MTCTYGGIPCLDPAQELANCRQVGAPTPWAGIANSFTCPQGPGPGSGCVLMLRGDLLSLNLNTLYPLVFSDGRSGLTLQNILALRAYNVMPAGRGDPAQACWVELADRRELARKVPIDKAYNLRSSPGGAFFSGTLNSGSPWAWAEMAQDLWNAVGKLGTWPGLPFTPDGTPEGFAFWASYAFGALNQVLDRLGCVLNYDPIKDTFTIVRLGLADLTATRTFGDAESLCVWDSDPIESVRGRLPAVARVVFSKQLVKPDATGASPYYVVDVPDPTTGGPLAGTEAGTVAMVTDDLPAIYDATGTLTNTGALASRAQERAADYFRRTRQSRFYRGYTGSFAPPGLLPGAQLTATLWRDGSLGVFTEILRLPSDEGGIPFAGLPGPGPAGGQAPADDGFTLHTVPGLSAIPNYYRQMPGLRTVPYPFVPYTENYASPPGVYAPSALVAQQVAVQNVDGTQLTPLARLIQANNDGTLGFIKWTNIDGTQGYFSWMGLLLYKDGSAVIGPRQILEVQDDGGVTGVVATITDDATNGRAVLKYSWKGLTLAVAGTNYGPEPKLEVIAGAGIALTPVDDAAGKQTQLTIENADPADHKVYVSGTDTTPDFLKPKLVAGTGITITQNNVGANETLTFAATGTGGGGAGTATNYTPTTTDTFVDVFDLLSSNGLIGGVSLRNSGATHTLTYQIRVKDMFGNTGTTTAANLSPGAATNWSLLSAVGLSGVFFPYQEFALSLKSATTGQSTTASVWVVLAN